MKWNVSLSLLMVMLSSNILFSADKRIEFDVTESPSRELTVRFNVERLTTGLVNQFIIDHLCDPNGIYLKTASLDFHLEDVESIEDSAFISLKQMPTHAFPKQFYFGAKMPQCNDAILRGIQNSAVCVLPSMQPADMQRARALLEPTFLESMNKFKQTDVAIFCRKLVGVAALVLVCVACMEQNDAADLHCQELATDDQVCEQVSSFENPIVWSGVAAVILHILMKDRGYYPNNGLQIEPLD